MEEQNYKRQRTNTDKAVASHYNRRPQYNVADRKQSPIFQLKTFNNYIKSILIRTYTRPGYRVLDLCCGKGGDLLKYDRIGISHLVGIDVAVVSVEHARERYATMRNPRFSAEFYDADCFTQDLSEIIGKGSTTTVTPPKETTSLDETTDSSNEKMEFDVISIQFALHYAFESEEKLRKLLENVGNHLTPGNYFIGTCPNANWIVKRMRLENCREFGNDLYQIRFEDATDANGTGISAIMKSIEQEPFGQRYSFILEDAIDDCPEFLVHFPTLERIANEYGLQLRLKMNFHQYFDGNFDVELVRRMRVLNADGSFEPNQWEIAYIYLVFAFEKVPLADQKVGETEKGD